LQESQALLGLTRREIIYLTKVLQLMTAFEHNIPSWLRDVIVIPKRPALLMAKVILVRNQLEDKERKEHA